MPELAEIETVCRRLDLFFRGRAITDVTLDATDRYLFAFVRAKDVKKALTGATVTGTGRKGKYFWIELDRKPWPLFHLGMSGNWSFSDPADQAKRVRGWGGVKLRRQRAQGSAIGGFTRLVLTAPDGREASLTDPRRFGRLWLTDDPWAHPRIRKLGYDPLLDFPSLKVLAEKLKKRRRTIKAVLLDQALFAGVGNWLADEILYQARLSPHRLASGLTAAQVAQVRKQTLAVVRRAVKVEADYERFPDGWIFHHRWGKVAGARTARGPIKHEEIGGRTTAWVPLWQK